MVSVKMQGRGILYKVVVRPPLMYDSKALTIKKMQERKLETAPIKILR